MTIKRVESDITQINSELYMSLERNSKVCVGVRYYRLDGDNYIIDDPLSGTMDIEAYRFTNDNLESGNVSLGGKLELTGFDYDRLKSIPNSITGTTTHYQLILTISK